MTMTQTARQWHIATHGHRGSNDSSAPVAVLAMPREYGTSDRIEIFYEDDAMHIGVHVDQSSGRVSASAECILRLTSTERTQLRSFLESTAELRTVTLGHTIRLERFESGMIAVTTSAGGLGGLNLFIDAADKTQEWIDLAIRMLTNVAQW